MLIIQEEGKPYFLLCGRNDGIVKKPKGARNADKFTNGLGITRKNRFLEKGNVYPL
jgi:predicted esterase